MSAKLIYCLCAAAVEKLSTSYNHRCNEMWNVVGLYTMYNRSFPIKLGAYNKISIVNMEI